MPRWLVDNAAQRAVRDAVLGPGFYGPHSCDGRYVYIDKGRLATILQKQFAVDTIMQRKNGDAVCIEEKIVRSPKNGRPYTALTAEVNSCTVEGHISDGWMIYGQADWLNWAMCQDDGNVLLHIIDFPKFQEAFLDKWQAMPDFFNDTMTTQHNKTLCKLVDFGWIEANAGPIYKRLIHATPEGKEIVKHYNKGRYNGRI